METIKVNMTPCEDIKTIHASQNDNEAREWGFELHNNGEKIDSSSISDQLVFKAYEGGAEEILPTNGSTPTTSPFLGDIRYPQGLLTDQEFTYRQSPTEEDGLAKITDIKGNTIVWNQLVQNGNFASTDGYYPGTASFSVANNEGIITLQGDNSYLYRNANFVVGHKLLIMVDALTDNENGAYICLTYPVANGGPHYTLTRQYQRCMDIIEVASGRNTYLQYTIRGGINGQLVKIKNWTVFDLTKMGLDSITDPSEFTSLFSLPYYDYNQGTLLSFMGNGIKTVGKNRLNNDNRLWANAGTNTTGYMGASNRLAPRWFEIEFAKGQTYTISYLDDGVLDSGDYLFVGVNEYANGTRIVDSRWQRMPYTFTVNELTDTVRFTFRKSDSNASCEDLVAYVGNKLLFQLEEGSTASDYEPYIESTTDLPISTHFPTGMKSARDVYDELTEINAITRIGSVDLGSLNWSYNSTDRDFTTSGISSTAKLPTSTSIVANIVSAQYSVYSRGTQYSDNIDKSIALSLSGTLFARDSTYTTADAFKSAMSGVYLYYELATESESTFTTASLVTENSEIPLSNEDGVLIGKCTEQLSGESGFFDAKIKLTDEDGECYSNKIQLHVERSPQ